MSRMILVKGKKQVLGMVKNSVKYSGCYCNNNFFGLNQKFDEKLYASGLTIGNIVYYGNDPLGIISVDNTITKDNSIRIVSLKNMCSNNPDNGALEGDGYYTRDQAYGFVWTVSGYTCTGPNQTGNSFAEGTATLIDGRHDTTILLQATDAHNTYGNWRTATPPLSNPSGNNTAAKQKRYSPGACATWRYNPLGSAFNTQGYWYVPSEHELIILYQHLSDINAAYAYINNKYGSTYCQTHLPRRSDAGNDGSWGYWGAYHNATYDSGWGGTTVKFDPFKGQNNWRNNSCGAAGYDMVAFLKLNVVDGKLQLDETYHYN